MPKIADARPEDVQLVPIDLVLPWPGNPRRGDVEVLRSMYREFGQRRPILVQRSSNRIIGGNHWWRAMKAELAETILVMYVDVDDTTAKRLGTADNQAHERGGYDPIDMDAWMRDLFENNAMDEALGFTRANLDSWRRKFAGHGADADPDAVPPTPVETWVLPGDLITLGDHRILCADSRDPSSWTRLMAGEQAALVWTDPPYGANYVGRPGRDNRKRIAGDTPEQFGGLQGAVMEQALANLTEGRAIYVHAHAGAQLAASLDVAVRGRWYRQTIAWMKDTFVVGRADFHYQWEPIIYGWRPGATHSWFGDRKQSTVWPFDRPKNNDDHSTQKPVALVEHAYKLSSAEGELVVDPFAGSGTAIVAAERTGRTCYAIELDAANVQVAVERWEGQTGARHHKIEHAEQ